MVGYPFSLSSGEEVRYSVGNPMGFLSSWSSFALAHHFVMFWCCEDLGIRWSKAKYVILGDDVLIGDHRLGELYQTRVLSLGIGISKQKTYTSTEVCEFAKRYLYRGEEVSPFPVSSVIENLGDVSLLVSAIAGEARKGLDPKSGVPGSVGTLARHLGYRKNLERNMVQRAIDSTLATSLLQGTLDPVEFVLRSSGLTDQAQIDYVTPLGTQILSEAARKVIQEALSGGPASIDALLTAEIERILVHCNSTGVAAEALIELPLFRVYLSFENQLQDLQRFGVDIVEGYTPAQFSSIAEILVNPLKSSSWGLDRRKRNVRSWSRLARACRDVSSLVVASYEHGNLFGPPPVVSYGLPIRYTAWEVNGYVHNFAKETWLPLYLELHPPGKHGRR